MSTNVKIVDLAPDQLIDFKREAGRGRPSLGKVISINKSAKTVRLESVTTGHLEKKIPLKSILRIRNSRPTRRTKTEMIETLERQEAA